MASHNFAPDIFPKEKMSFPKHFKHFIGLSVEDADNLIEELQDSEDLECFRDLGIPDEMLNSFFSQFPLAYLLKNQNDFDKKKLVKIKYQGLTYTGSIDNHITLLSQQTSHRQLTIKLSHDGFKYSKRKYLKAKVCTHDMGNWYVLGEEILNEMPFLQKLKRESNSILVFYYNIKYARIDIKFFKNDENEEPFMLIIFESGNPVTPPEARFRF